MTISLRSGSSMPAVYRGTTQNPSRITSPVASASSGKCPMRCMISPMATATAEPQVPGAGRSRPE